MCVHVYIYAVNKVGEHIFSVHGCFRNAINYSYLRHYKILGDLLRRAITDTMADNRYIYYVT